MTRRRSFSTIYRIQRIILMLFFIVATTALSIPLTRWIIRLSPDHLFPLAAVLVLYMVLVVVTGSFIYYVSYIPFNLARAFDPIKNDIASGRITGMDQLGARITGFATDFFNFSFLDISHAFLQVSGSGLISHEDLSALEPAMEEFGMLEKSAQLEKVMRAGNVTLGDSNFHLYILPVWFGNRWLGYMGLLSRRRIGRFFQGFLSELENDFLDDQIMLIMQMSNQYK